MNNFTSMSVEIFRTEAGDNISLIGDATHQKLVMPRSQNMISIRAELPMRIRPKRNMFQENLSDETEEDRSQVRYIWFLFEQEEFELFAKGPFSHTFEDGYHRLDCCGDSCLFYDSLRNGVGRESHGKVEVAYFDANIPIFFRRYLLRVARFVWRGLEKAQASFVLSTMKERYGRVEMSDRDWGYNAPRVRLDVTQAQREHFTKLYGQGRGQVVVEHGGYKSEETIEQLAIDMKDPDFVRQYEGKVQMARNSTNGFHQTAKLYIRLDSQPRKDGISPGYYWQAYNGKGQTIMNGAVLPHYDNENNPHWSTHT